MPISLSIYLHLFVLSLLYGYQIFLQDFPELALGEAKGGIFHDEHFALFFQFIISNLLLTNASKKLNL